MHLNQMSQLKGEGRDLAIEFSIPRPIQLNSVMVDGSSVTEGDFASSCSITSPIKLKRTYTPDGKVSKVGGKQVRHGLCFSSF
jgi:hypothetical protein